MPFNSYPYFVFLTVAVLGVPPAGKNHPQRAADVSAAGLLCLLCLVAGRLSAAAVRLDPG